MNAVTQQTVSCSGTSMHQQLAYVDRHGWWIGWGTFWRRESRWSHRRNQLRRSQPSNHRRPKLYVAWYLNLYTWHPLTSYQKHLSFLWHSIREGGGFRSHIALRSLQIATLSFGLAFSFASLCFDTWRTKSRIILESITRNVGKQTCCRKTMDSHILWECHDGHGIAWWSQHSWRTPPRPAGVTSLQRPRTTRSTRHESQHARWNIYQK